MTRTVLDTSVLVSAAFARETAPRRAVRWAADNAVVLKSAETEQEFFRTIGRPKFANLIDPLFLKVIGSLFDRSELIVVTRPVKVCRDPDDDKFLSLAVNGKANVLVTGDSDLVDLHPFQEISILRPAEFLLSVHNG